ncbi:isoamyl acetate-hydrolyzing esterase [Stygiomarasmius scandens]|uniref:Isoamyl acetate-hydrolyzing esterase n=1 Tax=Marasmiellus scandens TaxID=2682957 RepID=A0ABR1JU66_9AGAR
MAAYVQDVIMLFGDSITQGGWEPGVDGFGQRLSHVYARKLDVINRGYSGYNTEWAIPVFEKSFATRDQQKYAPKVRLLVVWFGANDACIKPSPQHVPLPKFISNLKHIVNLVQSPDSDHYSPDTRIILVTPPPVNTIQRKEDLESRTPPLALDRLFETTQQYAEAVKDVGREVKVPIVDIWTRMWEAAGKTEANLSNYLNDGLHLNKAGYELMYEALMETIRDGCGELHPDKLEFVFPTWVQVAGLDA